MIRTKEEQIAAQEAEIYRLRCRNAYLERQVQRLTKGHIRLRAMFDRAEPPKPEEWHDMLARVSAEMEAENAQD